MSAEVVDLTRERIARKRGIQTALQGLGVDIIVAVALVILASLPDATDWLTVKAGAGVMAFTVAKSIVQAVVAWVLRRYADQSGFEPPVEARRALAA